MKINMSVDVEPFELPDSVYVVSKPGLKQDDIKPKQSINLNDLDVKTVEALCEDFKSRIMARRKNFIANHRVEQ